MRASLDASRGWLMKPGPPITLPFAVLVATQRRRLGMTLSDVAEAANQAAERSSQPSGAQRTTIYEYERGPRVPYPQTLRWLAEALQLPLEKLADAAQQQRDFVRALDPKRSDDQPDGDAGMLRLVASNSQDHEPQGPLAGDEAMRRRGFLMMLGGATGVTSLESLGVNGSSMQEPPAETAGHGVDVLQAAVPPIRRALFGFGAIWPMPNPQSTSDLDDLRRKVNDAYWLRQSASYAALGAALPVVLMHAQRATIEHVDEQQQEALRLLAEANHVTASFLKKARQLDLAFVAVDRGNTAAERTDDPLVKSVAAHRLANLLLAAGHLDQAKSVAGQAIHLLEPGLGTASPEHLSMSGALLLKSAIITARLGDHASAWQHLGEAKATARQLGQDRNDFWTAFGPTNVAIHEIAVAVDLGEGGRAVRRAPALDLRRMPAPLLERRAHLLIDLARGHAQSRHDAAAGRALLHAEQIAPEEVRHNKWARTLLVDLLQRQRRGAFPDLRELAGRTGILS
jgi:transcriptional regulator with XRE-family HTH domain